MEKAIRWKSELGPGLGERIPYADLVFWTDEVATQGEMILGPSSCPNISGVIYVSVTADARVDICLSAQERNLVI